MFRLSILLSAFLLSACADWPDVPRSETARADQWPVLLPIGEVAAPPADPDREDADAALLRRASALQSKATILRRPVPDDEAMERLRQRLAR